MRNARVIAFFGVLVALAVIAIIYGSQSSDVDNPDNEHELQVLDRLKPTTKQSDTLADETSVQYLVDKIGVPVRVIVGEAGVYPPRVIESDSVGHIDVGDLTPERGGTIDVLVRAKNTPYALWREMSEAPEGGSTRPLLPAKSVDVQVSGADGNYVEGAQVRLGRDAVSLIWVDATTNAEGIATFETIPAGDYVVHATWKGRSGHAEFSQLQDKEAVTVPISLSAAPDTIIGTIKNVDGEAVTNATVVFLDADGDLPLDIVESNMFGQYEASPSHAPSKLLVRHPKYATKQVSLMGSIPSYDVVLDRGKRVNVTVVTGESPVENALVTWSEGGFVGEAQTADEKGEALFESVPDGATFIARIANSASRMVKPKLSDEKTTEVVLKLDNIAPITRPFRFRIRDPKGVLIESISAEAGDMVCEVEFLAGNDWQISGCPGDLSALFSIVTSHGVVSQEAKLIDGFELTIPQPTPYVVDIKGDAQWARTTLKYKDPSGKISVAQLDLVDNETARWNATIYPGRYLLEIETRWVRKLEIPVTLGTQKNVTVTLTEPEKHEVWVVDRQSAPVTNAYLMVWIDGKTLHDVGLSAGQLPVEITIPKGANAEVLAIDPRRGEGRVSLGTDRITLDKKVGSLPLPETRVSKDTIATQLGVSFVTRDEGWMMDVPDGSRGATLGLLSKDLFVTAFTGDGQTRLIISRDGHYSELSFASSLPASDK